MKRGIQSIFAIVIFTLFAHSANAQIWKKAEEFIGGTEAGVLSQEEAANGIKEALTKGIEKGVDIVSVTDGYFGNAAIKIPFPPEAEAVESKLRAVGMGDKVDEAVLSMNRAAEDAAQAAKPIFIDAIKSLTIKDALDIVSGKEDAATNYLKSTTSDALFTAFKPSIETSLEKVNATKYWEDVITTYNKIPLVKKQNPDLAEYVTQKAIDGLFVMVAKEEKNIRENPGARTTDLLKKVFGQK